MQTITYYYRNPSRLCDSIIRSLCQWLPDSTYIKLRYRFHMGKKLNLKAPVTFQEKLQWLKLHDHNSLYTTMVDKILVKDYVASKIGREYVIPLLGVWDSPENIDWDSLPDRFVLKTNHSGGNSGVVICSDKCHFDRELAIKKLKNSLCHDVYRNFREWPYKNVNKKVFAEEYVESLPGVKDLPDYKFFCFNGKVKALFVATDRQTPGIEMKFDFYDENYNHLPFRQGHPNSVIPPTKPQSFEEMKHLAEQLSSGIPHVRVDFYEVNGKPMFGELTFYHFAGMVPFEPEEWDYKFGEWLTISDKF